MRSEVIMVLGRHVWRRGAGGWYSHVPHDNGVPLQSFVRDSISRSDARQVALVYEPTGMAHQEVECPKAGRSVFASISRIKAEFPVVVSEDLGWGMEPPAPVAGGSYSTLLHYELSSGLAQACRLDEKGPEVVSAWSMFTLVESCAMSRLPGEGSVLVLLPGFVGLASGYRGRRNFKVWPQPMSERDWRALASAVVGQASPDEERKGGAVAVVAEGEPADLCPCWDEIRNSGRLECLLGLDEVAACATHLPRRHPANMILGFPRRVNLDPMLVGIALAALALSAATSLTMRKGAVEFKGFEAQSQAHAAELGDRVAALEKNRLEIDSLRKELPEGPDTIPAAKAAALRALSAAVPDNLTLTGFSMSADDSFELDALLVGRDFDQESTRRTLAQNGLSTPGTGSWAYDAQNRRLAVRGKFEEAGK